MRSDGSDNPAAALLNRRQGLKMASGIALSLLGVSTSGIAQQSVQRPANPPATSDVPIFDMLPDWSHVDATTPMTLSDLVNLKDAVIAFLKRIEGGEAPTALLENDLERHAKACRKSDGTFDIKKASGLFLLLRIVFELPDLIPASQAETFGSWYAPEDASGVARKSESDDFHPSWPIYIARISNKLYIRSNGNPESIGAKPAYRIWDEYKYMRRKYKFRTSAYIKGLEFIFIADK